MRTVVVVFNLLMAGASLSVCVMCLRYPCALNKPDAQLRSPAPARALTDISPGCVLFQAVIKCL